MGARARLWSIAARLWRQRLFLSVLLLWTGRYGLQPPLLDNETDTLPLARQELQPDWLPRDWYLNQPPGYRAAFDGTVGRLAALPSFVTGAIVGRLLVSALFAFACQSLARTLAVGGRWLVLGLLGFLFLFDQSLLAGEWMVRGLEAKPFAYIFCLLGLSALLRRQYARGSCLLGLAVTFHVLVGLYATLCAGAMLICRRRVAGDFRTLLLSAAWFLPASALGWWAVYQHFLEPGGETARQAARIYVHFRVPWHLLPSYWLARNEAIGWDLVRYALCVVVLSATAWRHRDERRRLTATFALASLIPFAVGLFWAAVGADGMLLFYWFRFADTIVPFFACILLADLLGAGLGRWRYARPASGAVWVICFMLLAWEGVAAVSQAGKRLDDNDPVHNWGLEPARADVQLWVRSHTARDAVFFVDPFWDEFYLLAERARFVSFKNFPQTTGRIVEWYRRMAGRDANPLLQTPTPDPRDGFRERFRRLSAADILALAEEHGLTHAIVEVDADPFRDEALKPMERYRNERYIVYEFR